MNVIQSNENITKNMRIPRIVYSHMKIANDNYKEYKTKSVDTNAVKEKEREQ